jgi:hypothetical protein
MQQASKTVPGRFDFLRFSLAHDPMTLRHQRQSYSQLHGWPRGVVPSRLPFSFQGALVFRGFAAVQSLGYASPLCCNSGAGEQVAEGCRAVAGSCGTIPCVPAEGSQSVMVSQRLFPTKSNRVLTGLGGFRAENNSGT